MIVGFSGYARSGKDTAAETLLPLGYRRIAFADKLKEMAEEIDPAIYTDIGWEPLSQFLWWHECWDAAKQAHPCIRELLQGIGMAARKHLWEDVWVEAALRDVNRWDNTAVTDVRFPNEADYIRNKGGVIFRINRPGVGPANNHPSETALNDFNFDEVIQNDGSVEQLAERVRAAVEKHKPFDWM